MAEQLRAKHEELKTAVQSTGYNFTNLVNHNNKAAATRYRAELMAISKLTNQLRKLALEYQKSIPTKSRKKAGAKVVDPDDGVGDIEDIPEPSELARQVSEAPAPSPKKRIYKRRTK